MNIRAETVSTTARKRVDERRAALEHADLHPARGILLAVGISLLGWFVVLALWLT